MKLSAFVAACIVLPSSIYAAEPGTLPGAAPLTLEGDLSAMMVAGIDRFLTRETERAAAERAGRWKRDTSSAEAFEASAVPYRARLRKIIGAVDPRVPAGALELVATTARPSKLAENDLYAVHAVRWPVFRDVHGEGLLLEPKRAPRASAIALPDAEVTPEMLCGIAPGLPPALQTARRLAERGLRVVVPVLLDRTDEFSGNAVIGRFTNQPHREWIYRQAYELGRHVIGYEVEKVLALVDIFAAEAGGADPRVVVAGRAEGGLIALHAAALDPRIDAALVSAHFGPREGLWEEPIYRNLFALLLDLGDAELAGLIAPRTLVIEHGPAPAVAGPPAPRAGRGGAAPGKLVTPDLAKVEREAARARALYPGEFLKSFPEEGTADALRALLAALKIGDAPPPSAPLTATHLPDPRERQRRQVDELVDHTQRILRRSEYVRRDLWKDVPQTDLAGFEKASAEKRRKLWDDVIGRFPPPSLPASPRSRVVLERPGWVAHEVVLDVWPDVFAWGLLLVPRDLEPGERRPVVVCQHGLEGVPMDTVTDDPKAGGFGPYQAFTARLAERGFITFAPHNPYRGGDRFRVLQRKANPLGRSLFSVILAQHQRILEWLGGLPFVDAGRIGFYGLSYGGKTAVRVPPLLEGYALSICSADFNEWIVKNATVDDPHSYLFTGEYEMPEFDLGNTFNYAELAALMVPRPFMVERGHRDGVAPDEWVAYEFAKVRRLYAYLGLSGRTEIEFFNGPHAIRGEGTYEFLHRHLAWPRRSP